MSISQCGLQGDGAVETGQRLLAPPEPVQRHAEKIMGARLSRIDRQNPADDIDAFAPAALPARRPRPFEQRIALSAR
jgi:hypothetical protein